MSQALVQVSVVMPAYNAAAYIAESIQSVLNQDHPSFEVIVVDDGSTDATPEIVAGFGSAVRYLRQPNSGGCSAPRNNGARQARGEFLVFLDSDDLMSPGRLQHQVDALRRHPALACVTADYRNFSEQGPAAVSHFQTCPQLSAEWRAAGETELLVLGSRRAREILVEENFGIASALMFRTTDFHALHGFDEGLRASEDFDLLYRAALRGAIGILRRECFSRRLHDTNMSNNAERILRIKAESRAKLAGLETDPGLRRQLTLAAADYRLSLVEHLARMGRTGDAYKALTTLRPLAGPRLKRLFRSWIWVMCSTLVLRKDQA